MGIRDIPPGAIDIDVFIGEADCVGSGIGPQALKLLLEQLASQSVPLAGMSTSVDNTAAIRAYEEAGFERVQQYDDPHYGRCWIMATPATVKH